MKMVKREVGPSDGILDFEELQQVEAPRGNTDLQLEKVVQFASLPIAGWHDQSKIEDSKCKQSCVRDCTCVSHCSWLIA